MQANESTEQEQGFSLVELLIAIAVVGVLTAVAIVGIGGLVKGGSKSACEAARDSASAASATFFANSATGTYPKDFHDLIVPRKIYDIPSDVTPQVPAATVMQLDGNGWTLKMTAGTPADGPDFDCTYT